RQAFATARDGGTVPGMAASAAGLARLRLLHGDVRGALDEARVGLEVVSRKGIWAWGAEIAPPTVEAMGAAGGTDQARALVEAFRLGPRGRDGPLARAAPAACRGLVAEADGRHANAAQHFERAQRAYAALPRPHEESQLAARRGVALLSSGDQEGAAHLCQA